MQKVRFVFKLQSAMEYLMTYGWSILIIAIVLAALFSLGVFSSSNLGPRAQPNGCRVFRPNGPGTTTNINLEGICNGEIPEYVAQFNGQTSNVVLSTSGLMSGNQITIVIWAERLGNGNGSPLLGDMLTQSNTYLGDCYIGQPLFAVYNTMAIETNVQGGSCPGNGVWAQYVGTYNGVAATLYMNGVQVASHATTGNLYQAPTIIGQLAASNYNFNGLLSNAQIYNTALDANAVQALYLEGVGGAPIEPQYLVGWWPLNGDPNDYGGSNYNGAATSIGFTSAWTSGYTTP